jgi:hypothetical protein
MTEVHPMLSDVIARKAQMMGASTYLNSNSLIMTAVLDFIQWRWHNEKQV